MADKKRLLFIINPVSGANRKIPFEKIISAKTDKNIFDYEIKYTQHAGHARELAKNAAFEKTDIVTAVGGDGTVSEIAAPLLYSNTALAIIPRGSGNGLARHLKIPLQVQQALLKINEAKIQTIDAVKINDHISVNVSGCGFDARVAHLFANSKGRGFYNYARITMSEYRKFNELTFSLNCEGNVQKGSYFIAAIANSSQFGNNAYIAPGANAADGLMNIVLIRKIPVASLARVLIKLFNKTISESGYVKTIVCKKASIKMDRSVYMHIDGEPAGMVNSIEAEVLPAAIKIWC